MALWNTECPARPIWIVHFEISLYFFQRSSWSIKSNSKYLVLTLIALKPAKARIAQAARGAPLAVTATPLATGGRLLRAGAVVINKRAAWHSVGGFSWGSKVIELNGRRSTGGKKKKKKHSVKENERVDVSVAAIILDQ